jgi:GTP-binding protein LepA
MENIRNFVIIAHIDSGKSTLADRFLEITGTVPMRSMQPQYLDRLPLERERGITIKMAPVRMSYSVENIADVPSAQNISLQQAKRSNSSNTYILNLIDTPGHSDFSYEVSRALAAVEGAILLIDGTKGIQAQTLSNLRAAQRAGLTIIPAVNKIDLAASHIGKIVQSVAELLGVPNESVFRVSAKTGEGVNELLEEVVKRVPSPRKLNGKSGMADGKDISTSHASLSRALIFDSLYDDHKGIIAFVRIFGGSPSQILQGKTLEGGFGADDMKLIASGAEFKAKEVGFFKPNLVASRAIADGEIGYIATGLKEPALVKIGDTVIMWNHTERTQNGAEKENPRSSALWALPGYREPTPVVFISFYPDGATKFDDLKKAFEKLRLNDAALNLEPDANDALGRGLKVGFLGQLHFEITSDRLVREYNLEFLTSFPSIAYRVRNNGKEEIVKQPQDFPEKPEKVWEPIVALEILAPQKYLSHVMSLRTVFDVEIMEIKNIGLSSQISPSEILQSKTSDSSSNETWEGDVLLVEATMPLRELIRDFDDRLKSVSQGYASFTYELAGEQEAEVEKLEIIVVGDVVPALTRIVPKKDVEREGRQTVERLKNLLPKEQFSQAIQASALGRIIARETIPAMKKELGNFGKNGGDRTRKMKLWKKQQRGKKRLEGTARVELSPEVFREILKK